MAFNARANQYTPVRVSSLTPGLEPWSPLMRSEITLSMWPHMKPYRRWKRCDYRRRPGSPATSRRALLPDTGRTHRGLRVAPVRKHNRLFLCLSSVQRLSNTTLQITAILRHPTGCVCVSCSHIWINSDCFKNVFSDIRFETFATTWFDEVFSESVIRNT